MVGQTLRR
jgi:hypothetical protein